MPVVQGALASPPMVQRRPGVMIWPQMPLSRSRQITLPMRHIEAAIAQAQPRAEGALDLRVKHRDGRSAIDRFRASGAYKALFPRSALGVQAIVLNTGGGVTGGDRFALTGHVGVDAHLTLTTQAAERAYRAARGWGRVDSAITVEAGATLHWLPQELILYDGCALHRRLRVDLADGASVLLVEPVIFGRVAMGERLTQARFRDDIAVYRAGRPVYRDALRLEGDLSRSALRRAILNGAGAMACLVYAAPDAPAHLDGLRALLPDTAGASLLAPDLLVMRLVASDGFALRASLLPVLDRLSRDTLPVSWRL
ncbi:urease accessory protein UreD [Lacimonas salitolerans]|uniref:Urease accessory protein UreD n=1 Tax=Lacimonas salitolerans TaxID=1323750 RepID=A0ABW4EH92_9RHOB